MAPYQPHPPCVLPGRAAGWGPRQWVGRPDDRRDEMLLTWLSVTGMVVGPVLRPAVSLLASPRHASPCAVDRIDRATAVRLGAAAVVGVAPGVGVAPAVAAYPTLTIETTAGPMEFELWDDVAPAHVNSFRKLAQKGYFDGQAPPSCCTTSP